MSNLLNIILASQDGTTLSTEGTYCDKNIKIVPLLEDKAVAATKEEQIITVEEGYAGIGSVTVEAVPEYEGLVTIGGEPVNVQGGIVEVEELPTEDIDTESFYLCNGEYYLYVEGEWVEYLAPSGSLSIVDNGSVDVTDYKTVVVDVPSVIEVDELPTEDINTKAVYLYNGNLYRYEEIDGIVGTWVFDETWSCSERYGQFDIIGTVDISSPYGFDKFYIGYYENNGSFGGNKNKVNFHRIDDDAWYAWTSGHSFTITITGGNDITNKTFITWLNANATKQGTVGDWVEYSITLPNAEDNVF